MKLTFHIPLFLKPLADGKSDVQLETEAKTVGDALKALYAKHPGLQDRVMTEQFTVRPHVNIFVGEESIRFTGGLATPVKDGDVLTLLPAVSGGSAPRKKSGQR